MKLHTNHKLSAELNCSSDPIQAALNALRVLDENSTTGIYTGTFPVLEHSKE